MNFSTKREATYTQTKGKSWPMKLNIQYKGPSEKKMRQLQAKIGSFLYDDRVALFALSVLKGSVGSSSTPFSYVPVSDH